MASESVNKTKTGAKRASRTPARRPAASTAKAAAGKKTATKKAAPAKRARKGLLLEEISFKKAHRCFKKGRLLKFHPGVNLLVGDQGSGKSTVLQLLHDLATKSGHERTTKIISVTSHGCRVIDFDFERDNPRAKSYFDEGFAAFQFQMKAQFSSHGETINALLRDLERTLSHPPKDSTKGRGALKVLLLLDEPDMALSPRSAFALVRSFARLAEQGHQIIAAVHNPILISSQPEVLSLEHKRWLKPAAFLAAHEAMAEEATEEPSAAPAED
jgi:predicted ATPase